MKSYALLEDRISHLPLRKRRELAYIIKILFEEFDREHAHKTNPALREGRILKLVLFGSYARGGWVEDRKSGYFSDYDLLVVVNNERSAEPEYWYRTENRFAGEEAERRIKAPVELIVHSYEDINSQLAVGRPFFMDIMRDGVMLYEAEGYPFVTPGKLPEVQRHEEAQKYFGQWYKASLSRFELSKISFAKAKGEMNEYMRDAAFDAHQAVERIYHCLLLTLTLYSPKLHDLHKLRVLANAVAPELADIWPRDKRFYKRSFARLLRAYVEGRYSPHYEITAEELQWLHERIALLQNRVREICGAYLRETGR